MKRRDALKRITTAGGSVVFGLPGWSLEAQSPPDELQAKPIRGLVRKDGQLWQPIQITLPETMRAGAVVKVDGAVLPLQRAAASPVGEILIPAVEAEKKIVVAVESNGQSRTATVTLKPVRQVVVYVLPHSHHDLGYTAQQADVETKQVENIDRGISLAAKTQAYAEGARFVWNLEVLWGAQLYLQRASPEKRAAFIEAVKKGWLALNGMYANELTGLCRPEELVQLFRYGTQLATDCGVKVDSAMLSDVPGFTWGTVTAMAQAGIRYVSAAPNWFDRIGTLMVEWQDKPFWWISPSGKERVLLWIPWTGYAMSHVVKKTSDEWVANYQDRLNDVRFPYSISYIRWSGHGDNAEPDPEISEFFNTWNSRYEWPKFKIASTSEAFSAFEKKHGRELPERRGDLTPYWEDGAGSSALETALNRGAADKLVQAEALFAMNGGTFPTSELGEAWRNVLLYSEHTWGAWNSVSDSENKFVTDQWKVKREFAVNADRIAQSLLTQALPSMKGATDSLVRVHNTTSWSRSEVVTIPVELSAGGDHAADKQKRPVPSQRLAAGGLAVAAKDVPAFSVADFHLSKGDAHFDGQPVTVQNGILDNGLLRARIDLKTGNIVELHLRGLAGSLVDMNATGGLNEFLFLEGSNTAQLQKSGEATVTVEEHGPLVAALRIESAAPGCQRLTRIVKLTAGADYLEIINTVDKKQAPLNPQPGKGGPGDEFAQRGNKESIQFGFPFLVKDGQMRVNAPLAVMRPDVDQLPGSCKNWLPVGRWIDVSNAECGVTWISLDAPLVELGELSAKLLGSQRDPAVWRKQISSTQKIYSWVMNNHWGTNYRAYQEGPVTFRYALCPHKGFDSAAASRLAVGMSQTLLPATATAEHEPNAPLLRVDSEDVLVTALKPSDDAKATIVRLFGASGQKRTVKLNWLEGDKRPMVLWRSNVAEQRLEQMPETITVDGWELLTIRAERQA